MRILLDNCVRSRLRHAFHGHEATHVTYIGWEDLRNGDLLRKADERFDVLVTVDKNMRFQSNLRGMHLRVAVLEVKANDFGQLVAAVESLLPIIDQLPEGEFTVIALGE